MKTSKLPKIRPVKAWAIVSDTGRIDPDSIRAKKSEVSMSIFEEENGYRVRQVTIRSAV